jgi:outer membrane protein, adhesin transport system
MPGVLRHLRSALLAGAMLVLPAITPAQALSLKEAVGVALESNPEIGQAIENREAIQFELRQARGLYLPRIDLEGSAGVRRLDTPTRRLDGRNNDTLNPFDISIVATQNIFDGFARESEVERQASRVDGASFRVLERSEFIALQIAREYFEALLQTRIVELAMQNVSTHESVLRDIRAGEREGTFTAADTQQAEERLLAARSRLIEAQEEMSAARIRFNRLVGMPLGNVQMPPDVAAKLPANLEEAIGHARRNNPLIQMVGADVDAADAVKRGARSRYMPEVFLEGRARTGRDIDGIEGRTEDLQARVVMRWNIYDGGIKDANVEEQIRRASEERLRLHQAHREVEESVRLSWDRRVHQQQLLSTQRQQLEFSNQVVSSYTEQFQVGRRSLLDLLDAHNTRYNVRVLNETARYAILFADYRLLAATGTLLAALDLRAPHQAEAPAREAATVPETEPAVTDPRTTPPIQPFGLY